MKRSIIEIRLFSREITTLIKKRRLLQGDLSEFKSELAKNPELGDLIAGTSGCRKIRLKSSSKGKSGGFRICYFDISEINKLYLIFIYAKNDKENLTAEEKTILKELVTRLKKEAYKNE